MVQDAWLRLDDAHLSVLPALPEDEFAKAGQAMTYALLGLVALLIGTNITLTVWWRGANKDKNVAEDLAHAEQKQRVQAQEELRLANLTIQAREAEMAIVKERLVTAEQQRNEATEAARDHFVRRLQDSKIADAAKLVADLLADPLPGVVLPKRSDDAKDGLLDPFDPAA